ncbi:MAG TPA: hypothetical protein VJ739_06425 [Gemmataceae bacterium]|nr:hypothetical protein [Gemmataceae bacterium]
MKRRAVLGVALGGVLLALAALGSQKKPGLLLLEWAARGSHEAPPVAVLIEMGMKDGQPTSWAGRAVVRGAKVVHREGYRFRDGAKLEGPDGWAASSHRPLRAPRNQPAVVRMEGMASVGVVLHLADVKDDATLMVEPKNADRPKEVVKLGDVLAGHA